MERQIRRTLDKIELRIARDPASAIISDAEKAQTLISNFSAKFLHIASDRDREPNFRSPKYLDYLKKNNWKSVALGHRLSGQVPSIVNFDGSIESIRSEGLSNDDFEHPTAQ